jgi:ribulose-5-phosphate 4-epimerase/fuculose-1-phosphate aldolase
MRAHLSRVESVKDRVSSAEWQTRIDLAACYRLVALYGWHDTIYNHISARVPGEEGSFLLNPFGMTMRKSRLRPSSK